MINVPKKSVYVIFKNYESKARSKFIIYAHFKGNLVT